MAIVRLNLGEQGRGAFILDEGEAEKGEMSFDSTGHELTVYHTHVNPEAEGKGYAKQLLDAMVSYARQHSLQVLPICPYVLSQFRRHPDQYADIWMKQAA